LRRGSQLPIFHNHFPYTDGRGELGGDTHGDGCSIDEDVGQVKMGDDSCRRMWSGDRLIPSRISEASIGEGLCRRKSRRHCGKLLPYDAVEIASLDVGMFSSTH
jgi:hypothetical protein